MTRCFIAVFVLSITPQAQAKLWHATQKALAGIDPNDQVRTISEAAAHLAPGDTLLLHGGVYRETVTLDKSGTAEESITIRAAEGETVTLTGADRITD